MRMRSPGRTFTPLASPRFKIDNDADKRDLRRAIRTYKAKLKSSGQTNWGLKNPREGVLLSELVVG